jgi:hypothetical protein
MSNVDALDLISLEKYLVDHGIPIERELQATKIYAELTESSLCGFDRYRALALFKLAGIAEGIATRHRSGVGNGPGFETAHQAAPGLLAAGLSIMAAQR